MTSIIEVTLDQIEDLQNISQKTFLDTFGSDNSASNMKEYLDNAYSTSKLTTELTDKNSFFFFAVNDNDILGYIKLNIGNAQTEEINGNNLEVERIYVKKQFKHQGIGKLLFNQALDLANYKSKDSIWLGVWENNKAALNFYHKLGFNQIGEHIFQLGDDAQRDLIMQKYL